MKKIVIYIFIMCLIAVSSYAGITNLQSETSFDQAATSTDSYRLTFTNISALPWNIGDNCVLSTNKEAGSTSELSTTFNLLTTANISFEWNVSSEVNDSLRFYINNKREEGIAGTTMGTTFETVSRTLSAGTYTLKWTYTKDANTDKGDDTGYLRNIYVDPSALLHSGVSYCKLEATSYDFGKVNLEQTQSYNIPILNTGSETLNITAVTVDAPFSIGNYAKQVTSGQRLALPVSVNPTAAGQHNASVTIETDGGTQTFAVTAYTSSITKEYNVTTPGSLVSLIPDATEQKGITEACITGSINADDLNFIREKFINLNKLDLRSCDIENQTIHDLCFRNDTTLIEVLLPGTTKVIGVSAFDGCKQLTNCPLPSALTTIGSAAFNDTRITYVEIPDGVTEIPTLAFGNNPELKTVIIGKGVRSIASYNNADEYWNGYKAFGASDNIETITIKEGLKEIAPCAFSKKSKLTTIVLEGNTLQTISEGAFYQCPLLSSITIPNTVREIGTNAFAEAALLTNCILPDSLRTVGAGAFNGCESFTNYTLPDSLNAIGSNAFNNTRVASIKIPEKVTEIPALAFGNNPELKTVIIGKGVRSIASYNNADEFWDNHRAFGVSNNIETITIEEGLKEIAPCAFCKKSKLTTIILKGDSLQTIDEGVFYQCPALSSVTLPNSVRNIGINAFKDATSLTSIALPDSLRSIGHGAFNGCYSLTEYTLPDSLNTIGQSAFNNTRVASIEIPEKVIEIPALAFGNNPELKTVIIGKGVRSIESYNNADEYWNGYKAFGASDNIETITIKEGLKEIAPCAFSKKSKLTTIIMEGDSLQTIDEGVFYQCPALSNVTLPNSVRNIGINAFTDDISLTSLVLPDSLRTVGNGAFNGCNSLTEYTLPDSLSIIGQSAFNNTRVTSIEIPEKVTEIPALAFGNNPELKTVIIGKGVRSIASYNSTDEYWNSYKAFGASDNIETITIKEGLREIAPCAFSRKSKLAAIILEGDSLQTIAEGGFLGCSSLTEISIPKVKELQTRAFANCSSLKKIPDLSSVETFGIYVFSEAGIDTLVLPKTLSVIPEGTFYNCDSLRSITLDNYITSVSSNAFAECDSIDHVTLNSVNEDILKIVSGFTGLRKISFGDAVISIPNNLLSNKANLEEVIFGKNVKTIGESAFSNSGLKEITLTDPIVLIGAQAFSECSNLRRITLGNGLTEIPELLFNKCTALESITFPASIRKIGSKAFDGCDSLRTITLNPELTEIGEYAFYNTGDKMLESITIPENVRTIGAYAFAGCDTLSSITIGAAVDSIAPYSFANCVRLKNITLPDNIRKLGNNAFEGTALSSLIIPDKITSISGVFDGLRNTLTSVTLGNGITELPEGIFSGFSSLKSVKMGSALTVVPNNAFNSCNRLTDVTIGSNVTRLDAYSFGYCTSLKEITIPEKVADIHENAFYGTTLNQLTLNMEEIKDYAFNNRTDLTSITIGKKVKRIGIQAFGSTSISSIELPEGVTTLKDRAFYGCKKLKSIALPASVTSIGAETFINCDSLATVTIGAGSTRIGERAFYNNNLLTTITMTEGGTKTIAPSAFQNCSKLQNVTLATTDSIGKYAFADCGKLTSIHIPAKKVSNYAFSNCPGLTEITFAEGLDTIADYAFTASYAIKNLTFPNSLKHIGSYAFSHDSYYGNSNNLTSVTFGNGLESIGEKAFYNSPLLERIELPNSIKTIGKQAFGAISKVRSITIGSSIEKVESGAFSGTKQLLAIHWNSDLKVEEDLFSPATNCLMYVTAKTEVPQSWKNIIRDGKAASIEITDKAVYNCEKEFTAKEIIFRKNFSMQTGRGESKGWESIALPFKVTSIKFGSRELSPFGNFKEGTTPFWLRKMDATVGFTNSDSIRAHTPYIVAMPNNPTYGEDYNISGEVQFIGEGINVPITPASLGKVEGPNFDFIPTFTNVAQDMTVYALNTYSYETNPGSLFLRDSREVLPFEAYVVNKAEVNPAAAPAMYSIGGNGDITGLGDMIQRAEESLKVYSRHGILFIQTDKDRTIPIYNAGGLLIRTVEVTKGSNEVTGLGSGVYFLEGQKVIVGKE